jgi:hypothetical protein
VPRSEIGGDPLRRKEDDKNPGIRGISSPRFTFKGTRPGNVPVKMNPINALIDNDWIILSLF